MNNDLDSAEERRTARAGVWLESLAQDIRFASRTLRKNPVFTTVAVLTLALGIGANTALFTLTETVYLRKLPVSRPDQLVFIGWDATDWPRGIRQSGYGESLSYDVYRTLRADHPALSDVFGFAPLGFGRENTNVVVNGEAELADGVAVTGNYFTGLDVSPALGRVISDEDDAPGKTRVAVLGYGYWNRKFGGDRDVVGKTIYIDNFPCVILGVAPETFTGLQPGHNPDVYISLADGRGLTPYASHSDKNPLTDPLWYWMVLVGRLKPGINAEAARASLNATFQSYLTSTVLRGYSVQKMPYIKLSSARGGMDVLQTVMVDPIRILHWMVALILVVACTNLAALGLARATSRAGEMSVRLAMGASRGRVLRQLLVESLLLAFAGMSLGLLFASWGARTILTLVVSKPGTATLDVGLDIRVLAFAVGLTLLTSMLFGMVPAFRAMRVDLVSGLKASSRASTGGSGSRMRGLLVCAQVAVSLVLIAGAGLLVRTLRNLQNENLGFDREGILLFGINPTQNGYAGARLTSFYRELQERIEAIPGVRSASLSQLSLISGWVNNGPVSAEGVQKSNVQAPFPLSEPVSPHFFSTMGIPLILGRDFAPGDLTSPVHVAVVNQSFARMFWPEGSPLGRRFSLGENYDPASAYEVIGIVQDSKFESVRSKIHAIAYYPYTQTSWKLGSVYFEVKTAADPAGLLASIRTLVRSMDPTLPLYDVKTQSEQIRESLSRPHMFATLSSFFAVLALLLAGIGIYGLLSYSVGRRAHEIGIRMALGAQRETILTMVLKQGAWLAGAGTLLGLAGAILFSRMLRSYLFGIEPRDPWTLCAAAAILIVVALAASWIPARRATKLDPIVALRYE